MSRPVCVCGLPHEDDGDGGLTHMAACLWARDQADALTREDEIDLGILTLDDLARDAAEN